MPATPRTVITPEQFDAVYTALPDADAQLLVETAIESGLRWGELTELRVRDLDMETRMLTVSRKVIEINREFHPDGKRFLVKNYPKDKEYRRLKLSPQITAKLKAHIEGYRGPQPRPGHSSLRAAGDSRRYRSALRAEPHTAGFTQPNEAGRQYRHGTLTAYNAGKCHCTHCRRAYADYRAARRAANGDSSSAAARGRRGRAHRAQLVPAHGLAPGLRSRWRGRYARVFMTSGIHMRRGCSPAEPTCRS